MYVYFILSYLLFCKIKYVIYYIVLIWFLENVGKCKGIGINVFVGLKCMIKFFNSWFNFLKICFLKLILKFYYV